MPAPRRRSTSAVPIAEAGGEDAEAVWELVEREAKRALAHHHRGHRVAGVALGGALIHEEDFAAQVQIVSVRGDARVDELQAGPPIRAGGQSMPSSASEPDRDAGWRMLGQVPPRPGDRRSPARRRRRCPMRLTLLVGSQPSDYQLDMSAALMRPGARRRSGCGCTPHGRAGTRRRT
jgi:hypothetical protein